MTSKSKTAIQAVYLDNVVVIYKPTDESNIVIKVVWGEKPELGAVEARDSSCSREWLDRISRVMDLEALLREHSLDG